MMTFEEFFLKKKIDLEQLAQSKPELFFEFKYHFEQMSEKSFDHTKKYWFNDLRRQFPLSEEKEVDLKEAFKPKDIIPPAEITEEVKEIPEPSAPNPLGFKPRFKAASVLPKAENEEKVAEPKEETITAKPAGFKPRFKAGQTSQAESQKPKAESEEIKPGPAKENSVSKPSGFKPRFKAGQTQIKKDEEK
jgi:hypothetical protein